jgi:uncharacterized membrane protein
MILEIVIYIVVVFVIATSLSLLLESLTSLVKNSGHKGKRDVVVSISAIAASHYFFKECTSYFKSRIFDYDYEIFFIAGLFILGLITATRETIKYREKGVCGEKIVKEKDDSKKLPRGIS